VLGAGLSAPTNGVYLAIGSGTARATTVNEPLRISDELVFLPFCDSGKVQLAYATDPAYSTVITMSDRNGVSLPRTALGRRFGSRFDRLHNITDVHTYTILAWGSYTNNPGLGGGRFFTQPPSGRSSNIRVEDLFKVKAPGTYTLRLEMQMFRFDPKGTSSWKRSLFRFPPVTVTVEKPPDS